MTQYFKLNWNLGVPQLLGEWKKLLTPKDLLADISAGTTVAFVAIPLSLAIALASGVSPGTGLVTALIAGIVCALFGGTTLAVSGPAAAMSVLLADIVEKFGFTALVVMCLIAGVMQLLSGILGLGKLSRYVPLPVIAGFTAGIGVIILISQLPRVFGLEPPDESHIFSVFTHIRTYFYEINGACLFLVIATITIIRGLPKLLPKVPPILPAVAFSALFVYLLNLDNVPLIGAIPNSLPAPTLPQLPDIPMSEILFNSFTIFVLASLETLLSSTAIDKLSGGKKHDSNQELIGQGLGNIAVSLFSGIPVTGVIARSATNVKAGAKTRRASIIHSIIILLAVFAIAPVISMIPIAALAGVLVSVAFSMINYKEFYDLWRSTRSEAFIYAITFGTIIFVDLIAGVQAGIIAAALILLWKASTNYTHITNTKMDGITRFSLSGPLTFLSIGKITELESQFKAIKSKETVLLDVSDVTNIDSSGASAIIELYLHCHEQDIKFYIKGLQRRFEALFQHLGGEALLNERYLMSEHDLRTTAKSVAPESSRGRLIHGVQRFYAEGQLNDKRLFDFLRNRQNPHTLFLACSDSRVIPSKITSTDPGELFIIRNIGNCIPPYEKDSAYSEIAALEFALNNFDITDIVVCGHANCGAIMACCSQPDLSHSPSLDHWINMIRSQLTINATMQLDEVIRQNVLKQINNLKHYPIVQEKLAEKKMHLHAWFFDFDKNMVYEYDAEEASFKSLIAEPVLETT